MAVPGCCIQTETVTPVKPVLQKHLCSTMLVLQSYEVEGMTLMLMTPSSFISKERGIILWKLISIDSFL